MTQKTNSSSLFDRIYRIVRMIPEGQVATYGQVAQTVGNCTPRLVGYALAALPADGDVPWHRVVNRRGMISLPAGSDGAVVQRLLLVDEGVFFDQNERIDFCKNGWQGPEAEH